MIKWSKRGNRRRTQCVRYIANESQDWFTAWRWEDDVFATTAQLNDFPESGSIVCELRRDDIRQVLVGDYRVIYRVKRRNVEILTVRHMALLWNTGSSPGSCTVTVVQKRKRKGAMAMLGYAATFRETRPTEEWMKELREGEEA